MYGKLFYKISENGEIINAETDGLVIYDNNLFILEAKAGQYHPSAQRGSIEKIKEDVERLISDAYNQALRTKDYIFTTTNPVFKERNGRIILEIEDISKFQNVFLLNPTLENLGHLSSHLNSLRQFGLIEGREWPWSVFLNDLRTISELVETPSEFLMYLKRRIRANDFPAFSATDELDFLMVYFREGFFFEDGHLDGLDYYKPSGYTDAIDRYYHSQMGLVSSSEKPTLRIPSEYRTLIINIEKTEKFGFSQVTTALLDFKLANQKEILDYIEQLSKLAEHDKKCHDATFITDDLKSGLTIVVDPDNEYCSTKYDTYSNFKKYQTHSDTWIILILQITEKQIRGINFEIKNFPWKYSQELEQKVKRSRLSPEGAHPDIGKRIGRNEKCPCGSGKKFKKCCGDRVRENSV